MNNRSVLRIVVLLLPAVLAGCGSLFGEEGYFRDRGDDYLKADVIAPIDVPQGIEQQEREQLYIIPAIATDNIDYASHFQTPRPQALSENAFSDKVKIQKLEDKRWILVSAAPTEVWPQVRGFLSRNNLEVVYTDATAGVIETGWLKFTNDEVTQNKYRLQIEQGIQPDSTEIHVLHLSVDRNSSAANTIDWPQKSTNADREAWMVDELAGVIASDTSGSQAASLLAQTIGLSDKVTLNVDGEEPVLRLNVDYTRSQATIIQALDKEGFTFWAQNTKPDLFYVHYAEVDPKESEEPGFFGRLFGKGKPAPMPVSPYSLAEVLANLKYENSEENRNIFAGIKPSETSKLTNVPGFLVVMSRGEQQVEVRIRNAYGQRLSKPMAKRLLAIIRHNLI